MEIAPLGIAEEGVDADIAFARPEGVLDVAERNLQNESGNLIARQRSISPKNAISYICMRIINGDAATDVSLIEAESIINDKAVRLIIAVSRSTIIIGIVADQYVSVDNCEIIATAINPASVSFIGRIIDNPVKRYSEVRVDTVYTSAIASPIVGYCIVSDYSHRIFTVYSSPVTTAGTIITGDNIITNGRT